MKTLKVVMKILLILAIVVVVILLAVVLFLEFSPTVGKMPGKKDKARFASLTSQFHDGKFNNENSTSTMTGDSYPSSNRKTPKNIIKAEKPEFLTDPGEEDLTFTWFGHSSFMLQMGGKNILVDPVFSKRCSPVGFAGPKRFSELPLEVDELPNIDVLFISHDHYDHLDYKTVRALKDKVEKVIVPLGLDVTLKGWGFDESKIIVLNWWESVEIGGMTFTHTPSQHFTGRNPLKGNSTFWGGIYISNDYHKVYYTGDGGYYDVFEKVGERLGAPDLMIAECGQYDTAWAKVHMFPEETAKAAADVKAKWVIPVHWGTFSICNHAWDDSITRVTKASETENVDLATPRIGQTVNYDEIGTYTEHWWEEVE